MILTPKRCCTLVSRAPKILAAIISKQQLKYTNLLPNFNAVGCKNTHPTPKNRKHNAEAMFNWSKVQPNSSVQITHTGPDQFTVIARKVANQKSTKNWLCFFFFDHLRGSLGLEVGGGLKMMSFFCFFTSKDPSTSTKWTVPGTKSVSSIILDELKFEKNTTRKAGCSDYI